MAGFETLIQAWKKATSNPAIAAGLLGLSTYGAAKLATPLIENAYKHISRKMNTKTVIGPDGKPHLVQEEPEELSERDKLSIPYVLGIGATGATLASSWRNNQGLPFGGLFTSWDDPRRANPPKPKAKQASVKQATYNFSWDMNDQTEVDFGKLIPVRMAQSMVINDPYTEVYHKGNALDIINNASNGNDNKITAGSLFDSALNKVQKNLTAQGITNAVIRGAIGYGMAKAFTNTVSSFVDMPKGVQRAIVDAGMITNVIQGLY